MDIAADLPKGTALLNELLNSGLNVISTVDTLFENLKDIKTENGLSILELKNELYLSYLANLSMTVLLKLSGRRISGHPSVDRLIESRVALERVRPLEEKIKYQICNYIKATTFETSKENDQINVKNSLDNIEDSSDDEEKTEEDSDSQGKNQLYKVPKISQTYYPDDDETAGSRQKRERARMLSSLMLKDALEEYTEDPEVHHNMDTLKQKSIQKQKEIERYEEENFTRLSLTKKEKAALRQMATPGTIGTDLLAFRSMEDFEGHAETRTKSKKRKAGKTKAKKGKGFKKRKKH